MRKKISIFGSNSILTYSLVDNWHQQFDITVASSKSGAPKFAGKVNEPGIEEALTNSGDADIVVIISALLPSVDNTSDRLFEVNVHLVSRILQANKKAKIIYCSTISVYEGLNTGVINEQNFLKPQNEYAISKLWAEELVKKHNPKNVIFRIASLCGKGMNENTFLPIIVKQAIDREEITLFGDGKRLQNYIHVSDLTGMINAAVVKNLSGMFLAVSKSSYQNRELAQKIKKKLPNVTITYLGDDDAKGYMFDASETYAILAYTPRVDMNAIIDELIEWKKEQY